VIADIGALTGITDELLTALRVEAAHVGQLSQATLERLTCDCKISRILMDGPSQVLNVGRATRTVPTAQWNALVAATTTAPTPAAPAHPPTATPTTSSTGHAADPPTSPTSACSAGNTTENNTSSTHSNANDPDTVSLCVDSRSGQWRSSSRCS
jgi:hypothetical protein